MVCVAGHQCPSVCQVKGHSAKHSHRETDADRAVKTEEMIHWRHLSPHCIKRPYEASQSFAGSQSACLSHSLCITDIAP